MENNNKETIWITIPEEKIPAPHLPVEDVEGNPNKVKNKSFWGAGFVALLVFSSMLLAPQHFGDLIQGQLFDGTFQVVPDYEDQQSQGELFGGEEGDVEGATDSDESDSGSCTSDVCSTDNVVDAEDAVTIQIEPLSDTDAELSDEITGATSDSATETAEALPEAVVGAAELMEVTDSLVGEGSALDNVLNSLGGDLGTSEEASDETAETTNTGESELVEVTESEEGALHGVADANLIIDESAEESSLESSSEVAKLSAELEEFKKMQEENQALIAQLTQMIANGATAADLHAASTAISPSLTVGGQEAYLAQQATQSGTQDSAYRYNTHTVTVSPYDVLKNNQTAEAQIAQMEQAYQNSMQGNVQAYDNSVYNPVLSNVEGQPSTGPAESLMVALLFVSIGVLVWGSLRAARA